MATHCHGIQACEDVEMLVGMNGVTIEDKSGDGDCAPPVWICCSSKRYAEGDPYRLIPRCVTTQASGKKRLIDDAARGGQSASSRDSNKLVFPLRPALHIQAAAASLQECTWERFAQQTPQGAGLCGAMVPPRMERTSVPSVVRLAAGGHFL